MKLHKLKIKGFRKLKDVSVAFGDATFCIGMNNAGKSSVLHAIERLLSHEKRIPEIDFYSEVDVETGENKTIDNVVSFEAEFRNLPNDAESWRGFKGRIFKYEVKDGEKETGLSVFYKKTYSLGKDVVIEIKAKKRRMKEAFSAAEKPQQLIDAGLDAALVSGLFKELDKKIAAKDKDLLMEVDELWDLIDEEEWVVNPGGIPAVVLSKMPRFIRIPAESSAFEIEDIKKGVLGKTLNELFEEVRDSSKNYKDAQDALNKLSDEMNPADGESKFGQMMTELNTVLSSVFPESKIHAKADLSDPDKVLLPAFAVQLSSNIKTPVSHQGTGMVRAAVFGILRYRQKWVAGRDGQASRSLIIGFEEPEIYLHPSASNQMRDTIYELSSSVSQIVSTTHSPYMIDLSRSPRQVLNKFTSTVTGTQCISFNVSDEFLKLSADDQSYVKMILKIDDYVARSFFTKKVIIVEGDTEDIVFKETLKTLPSSDRLKIKANYEIIKARGKATIIGLCKYFNSLGVEYCVIHDRDAGVPGAEKFNAPIKAAAGANGVYVLEECIEDVLGYSAPDSEKPLTAYEFTKTWDGDWAKVPEKLKKLMRSVFIGNLTV